MASMTQPTLPTPEEQEQANELLHRLAPLGTTGRVHVRSEKAGKAGKVDMILPEPLFRVLLDLLRHTASGNAVTVVPVHAELTSQQAADLLNVSRPHLIKLLDEGALPFHRTGRHRRVFARDLFEYRDEVRAESEKAFQELADLSQEDGLGY